MYLGFLVSCDFIFVVLLNSIKIKMFLQEEWMWCRECLEMQHNALYISQRLKCRILCTRVFPFF